MIYVVGIVINQKTTKKTTMDNNKNELLVSNTIIGMKPKKKVMFKFDQDEPQQLANMDEGSEFTIVLKGGQINFTSKSGKVFSIFLED